MDWLLKLLGITRKPNPASFLYQGRIMVDGYDYYGPRERALIERHGLEGLNFCPSTPPAYR